MSIVFSKSCLQQWRRKIRNGRAANSNCNGNGFSGKKQRLK